jgi:hypothetical protein
MIEGPYTREAALARARQGGFPDHYETGECGDNGHGSRLYLRRSPDAPRNPVGGLLEHATVSRVGRGADWFVSFFEDRESAIARRFADHLRESLSPEQWREMRLVNRGHTTDKICASHDYCDANMPMDEAFQEIIGHEIDCSSDTETGIWNRAWDLAKERFLTAAEDEHVEA